MSVTLDDDDEQVPGLRPDGKPDPAYAAAIGLVPASPAKRSLAFAVDAVIVAVITLPLTLVVFPLWIELVLANPGVGAQELLGDPAFGAGLIWYIVGQGLLLVFVLIQLILHGIRGITIGKAIVGLRSVDMRRFDKPGFWRIVLRALLFWSALAVIPVVGAIPLLLSSLWDPQKRGRSWLDLVGGNWLVDTRRGLDPFDRKALRHARKRELTQALTVEDSPRLSLATSASGALPSFMPAERSSSGVIGLRPAYSPPTVSPPWVPPPVGGSAPSPLRATTVAPGPNRAVMVFDDGVRVAVDSGGLLGRDPRPEPDDDPGQLVPVRDATSQISKTHAAFGLDEDGFWVTDRDSTNGTHVTGPSGEAVGLTAWRKTHVAWGSTIVLGGRAFTVVSEEAHTKDAG